MGLERRQTTGETDETGETGDTGETGETGDKKQQISRNKTS